MLKIKVDNTQEFELDIKQNQIFLNGNPVNTDVVKITPHKFHLLLNDVSFTVELVNKDETGKVLDIMVNGVKQQVQVANEFDLLLKQLGMDKILSAKVNDVKAPMPGLVLSIKVKEGDVVKKGDALLTLEAMKMENVIKAPADATVKKINVSERTAVEKNQVLIVME